jgi:hypothetical protein
MAKAITEKFEEMVLELEETPASGTFTAICGLIDVSVTRSANIDSAEVPDCADESLPLEVEKSVRSLEVSVSASGVWAQSSHEKLMAWYYSGQPIVVRIGHLNATVGETEYETGPALITGPNNARTKGQKVSAELTIEFSGTPTLSVKI